MSNKTKIIIGVLFLVQIGIVGWSYWNKLEEEARLNAAFEAYLQDSKSVDSMDLNGQEINRLLDNMQQFENLKYLDLSNNNFQKFPTKVLELPKLEVLKMNNNQLKEVSFIRNNTLKRLSVNRNNIKKVGDISLLKSLEYFDLNFNKISDFPMINKSSKLDSILLNNNQLSQFFDIDNRKVELISYIDLSHNNFKEKVNFKYIINHVEEINIAHNDFYEFPAKLSHGTGKVKKLNASKCNTQIFNIEEVTPYIIEDLNISDNALSLSSDVLNQFQNLKVLNISGLDIDNLSLTLYSLETLSIKDIILFSNFCTFNLPKLKVLNVDNWFLEMYLDEFKNSPLEIINVFEKDEITDKASIQQAFPNATIHIIKSK